MHTNHLSVLDRAGNAVAITTSLGDMYGSAVVAVHAGLDPPVVRRLALRADGADHAVFLDQEPTGEDFDELTFSSDGETFYVRTTVPSSRSGVASSPLISYSSVSGMM